MERFLLEDLKKWKNNPKRKPLLLEGARGVGKTTLIEYFGKQYFNKLVKIDFEKDLTALSIFEKDLRIDRIIKEIEKMYSTKIDDNTLIFFDEIQKVDRVITSLKYFCEYETKYFVIASRSYLNILGINNASWPVGKVDILHLFPLTFSEFLIAINKNNLLDFCNNINYLNPISTIFLDSLNEVMKEYLSVGGMPLAVNEWIKNHKVEKVDNALKITIDKFEDDIWKYSNELKKITSILEKINEIYSKKSNKFNFTTINKNARSREYEAALKWIVDSNLFYKIYANDGLAILKKAFDKTDIFKIYLCDVGILRKITNTEFNFFENLKENQIIYKQNYYKNYVLTSLIYQYGLDNLPSYWSITKPKYEIDFLIQDENNHLIPIEVKSGTNTKSPSLKYYYQKHKDSTKLLVKYSMNNLKLDGNTLNIPLCLVDQSKKLIEMAFKQLEDK